LSKTQNPDTTKTFLANRHAQAAKATLIEVTKAYREKA
jgi:hypothetical protein